MSSLTLVNSENGIETLENKPNTPPDDTSPIATLNYDVLYSIFEYLDAAPDAPNNLIADSKKDLYRIALTCKQFVTPAVDLLWKHLNSIIPLLRLLPTVNVVDGKYVFDKAVWRGDHTRFISYAQRVRIYSWNDTDDLKVPPFTMSHLPNPLLPRLHCICCSPVTVLSSHITPLLLLSCPIEHIELHSLNVNAQMIEAFLFSLRLKVPRLEHLILRGPLSAQPISSALQLRYLHSLELSSAKMDLALFQGIASLPELQTLAVDIKDSPNLAAPSHPGESTCITFLKLKTLRMTGKRITSYFVRMKGGLLETITMEVHSSSKKAVKEGNWWDGSLWVMISHWKFTLRSLALGNVGPCLLSSSSQFFAQISKLQCLTKLQVKGLEFTTRNISSGLFPAIPCIQQLLLCQPIAAMPSPMGPESLSLLSIFAFSCPQAKVLQITFGRCIGFEFSTGKGSIGTHGLKTLIIGSEDLLETSNLQQALDVARYLDSQFPILANIQVAEGSKGVAFWKFVYNIVESLQEARRDERERLSRNKT